jgi:cbb3-type cytochrome oxidase subunit 3
MNTLIDFIANYGYYLGVPLAFLAIVLWVFRPGAKKRYEADGKIPFLGDKKAGKARSASRW